MEMYPWMTKPCYVAGAAAFPSTQCSEKAVLVPDMQEDIHDIRWLAGARCATAPWLLSVQVSVLRQRFLGHQQSKGPSSVAYGQQGVCMLPLSGGVQLRIPLEETYAQVPSNPSVMLIPLASSLMSKWWVSRSHDFVSSTRAKHIMTSVKIFAAVGYFDRMGVVVDVKCILVSSKFVDDVQGICFHFLTFIVSCV